MGTPAVRSIVLVAFPFSDLTATKLRPAIVLADAGRGDFILCQITSNPYADSSAIRLTDADFDFGSLRHVSFARLGKLSTANETLIVKSVGALTQSTHHAVVNGVVTLLQQA